MKEDFLYYLKTVLDGNRTTGNFLNLRSDIGNGHVESPLLRGSNVFPRIKKAIISAKFEVLIIGYKIDTNSDGEKDLSDALEELSKRASDNQTVITVKILINHRAGVASIFRPNASYSNNKLRQLKGNEYPGLNIEYIEHTHSAFGAYHAKQFIIDNRLAILCSGDLTKVQNYREGEPGRIDIATILHGRNIVQYIRNDFITAWNSSSSQPLQGEKSILSEELEKYSPDAEEIDSVDINALTESNIPILYISKKENGNLLQRNHYSPHTIAVLTMIENAEYQIDIMMPNLNETAIIEALADAYARGVGINIVMGKYHNDSGEGKPFLGGTNRQAIKQFFDALQKRNVQHFDRLNIRWAADNNVIVSEHDVTKCLHAKLVCVDDVVIMGSSVLDKQSVYHSREGDACIQSPLVADQYRNKIFNPVFFAGIDLFLDPKCEIRTPNQDALHSIALVIDYMTMIFENKYKTIDTKKTSKRNILEDVLGINIHATDQEYQTTLYGLRDQILRLKKIPGNLLTPGKVAKISKKLDYFIKNKLQSNTQLKECVDRESFWCKLQEYTCDSYKTLTLSDVLPSTNTLFKKLGNHSSSELEKIVNHYSLFNRLHKGKGRAQDSLHQPLEKSYRKA